MAQNNLGLNKTFAIKNADGTPFHNLVLRKATFDSVVMSLGDKITGEVYYKDTALSVTMQEYIELDDVHYVLVNPPTIVREGMASENGELNGMTKYSFEFYHPMYMLGNFPFSDVAVSSDQLQYLSENKTFSWIGNAFDFIAKLNKNLQSTQWVVVASDDEESRAKMEKLSDVMSFDNAFISDALKDAYDTWEVPFVIDSLKRGEYTYIDEHNVEHDWYDEGKRFVVVVGLPSNEILDTIEEGDETCDTYVTGYYFTHSTPIELNEGNIIKITNVDGSTNKPAFLDANKSLLVSGTSYKATQDTSVFIANQGSVATCSYSIEAPFVFQYGQGLGLKNKSRTPKNNKIVTRIAGYGSERNIPYGYPQILWYGDPSWEFTEYYDDTPSHGPKPTAYPIYKGIVGGRYVKLIKHPFTRNTLMPSVYVETLFNKVSPYASDGTKNQDYDPDTTIIEYHDAPSSYPNPIVDDAPSYDSHQFETIYPELGEKRIIDVVPYDEKAEKAISKSEWDAYLYENTHTNDQVLNMYFTAIKVDYERGENVSRESIGGAKTWTFTIKFDGDYCTIYGTFDGHSFNKLVLISKTQPAIAWDDTMDDNGNYKQSYFKLTLPKLDFDLYACASITEKMDINMRGGACIGCTFPVQVDWEDYKKNFYNSDGEFDPIIHTTQGDGHVRDGSKYPDSSQGQITLIVQKDIDTFGTLMPNVYQQPKGESEEGANDGDKFVILGISLPQSYVTNAQMRLDEAMDEYMLENNVFYYEYPLKFDEHFLATHTNILAQIRNNTIVRFVYNNVNMSLYVKQITIKYGEGALPKYDITLTDDVEIVLNQLGQVTDDVSRVRVQLSELQKYYGEDIAIEIANRLSRVSDDIALGRITFQQGLTAIGDIVAQGAMRSSNYVQGMNTTGRGWNIDALGNAEIESLRVRSYLEVIQLLVNRLQAQEGDTMFTDNDQVEMVEKTTISGRDYYILTLKRKWEGYVTAQKQGNILRGVINTLAANQGNVSDVTEEQCVESDGENKYYTSWMVVEDPSILTTTLATNQIIVSLYDDLATPAQKNFEPCALMVVARWGCLDASASATQEEVESVKKRQQSFYISSYDGRITKLTGVNKPILEDYNYGTTLGTIPDFIKNNWTQVASRLIDGRDYLYAQGIIVGDFIKVDINGRPEINYPDKGEWSANTYYRFEEYNNVTLQWETDNVWYNGAYWRCRQSHTSTSTTPPQEGSIWTKLLASGTSIDIKGMALDVLSDETDLPTTATYGDTYIMMTDTYDFYTYQGTWQGGMAESGDSYLIAGDLYVRQSTGTLKWVNAGKIQGPNGVDATYYELIPDISALSATSDGTITSGMFYVDAYKVVGNTRTAISFIAQIGQPHYVLQYQVDSGAWTGAKFGNRIPSIAGQKPTNGIRLRIYYSEDASTILATTPYIPVIKDGEKGDEGEKGEIGRNYYFDKEYDDTKTYVVSDIEAPFVSYVVDGQKRYYVRIGENGSSCQGIAPSGNAQSATYWEVMVTDFKYLLSEAIFAQFAKFGSAIISGDFMLSAFGTIYDTTNGAHGITSDTMKFISDGVTYDKNNAYTLFDADYPNSSHDGVLNFVPKYCVNLKTGTTYQQDAYISGELHARSLSTEFFDLRDKQGGNFIYEVHKRDDGIWNYIAGSNSSYFDYIVFPTNKFELIGQRVTVYCSISAIGVGSKVALVTGEYDSDSGKFSPEDFRGVGLPYGSSSSHFVPVQMNEYTTVQEIDFTDGIIELMCVPSFKPGLLCEWCVINIGTNLCELKRYGSIHS